MNSLNIKKTGEYNRHDSAPVFAFQNNKKKQSVSSYPALFYPKPFLFSNKNKIILYEVYGRSIGFV